jgi:DNA invertase Pin-like site-specific DNA recombinase
MSRGRTKDPDLDKLREQVCEMYDHNGISTTNIALNLKIGVCTVLKFLKEGNIPIRKRKSRMAW